MAARRARRARPAGRGRERPVDRIEILAVELLAERRALVESLKRLARRLDVQLGWHYLLDLAWIRAELEALGRPLAGCRVLDAGAGMGLLQWHLAEAGAEVLSVDRNARSFSAPHLRRAFRIEGLRPEDLPPAGKALGSALRTRQPATAYVGGIARAAWLLARHAWRPRAPGRVLVYRHDLDALPAIADGSVDAVVSVSALEHNSPQRLPVVVDELMRTLKPGGVLLATLGAARDADWFHAPSQGWNYTDASLRRLFRLAPDTASNYADYDRHFRALEACAELREGLDPEYFRSGDNGMPWGRWAPQYQPVGVRKVKR